MTAKRGHSAQLSLGLDVVSVPSGKSRAGARAVRQARAAQLLVRLNHLGLRGVDTVKLMETRSVMVSLGKRTLRINAAYVDAPEHVLRAIVSFAAARNRRDSKAAVAVILSYVDQARLSSRRDDSPHKGDRVMLRLMAGWHEELNRRHFDGTLSRIPIRFSGRMVRRLGHFDPGGAHGAAEIVISRRHLLRDGFDEAADTLLHEMIHQWQHETGRAVDHGREFRRKAKEVGIASASRRTLQGRR